MEKSPHPQPVLQPEDWTRGGKAWTTRSLLAEEESLHLPAARPHAGPPWPPMKTQVVCTDEGPSWWALTDEVGRVGGPEEVRQVQPLDEC